MDKYLVKTNLLDFETDIIQDLIKEKKWNSLNDYGKIKEIYNFCKNEVKFGLTKSDSLKASDVLKIKIGQDHNKNILFMALLRAVKIPCRIHIYGGSKKLIQGFINGIFYKIIPKETLYTSIEVYYNNQWIILEGISLDTDFVKGLKLKYADKVEFIGYGIATDNLKELETTWNSGSIYYRSILPKKDYGMFINPDDIYENYSYYKKNILIQIYCLFSKSNIDKKIEAIRKRG